MDAAEDLDKYRAPALDKGLDILELLAASEDGMTQAEIAKALDRSANEIYRMLDRLVRRDYVSRTLADRYELTLKLFELAHLSPPMNRLVNHATPVLRRFARDAEQSVQLVIQDRNTLVVVAQVDGPGYWNLSIRVGARIGLANTGSGHVFLAFASHEERQQMLEGEPTREKLPAGLVARFARIRELGYAVLESQQVASVTNLSVPIFGPLGSAIAAITCPYVVRIDKSDAPDQSAATRLLIAAGREISKRSLGRD